MGRLGAITTALAVGIAAACALPPRPAAAAPSPEQRLVDRYAPVLMLKENDDPPCGRGGEQYLPAPVGIILGNPDVRLLRRSPDGSQTVVRRGATAAGIAFLGPNYYLDQRGTPYRPGCTYARDSQRLTRGRKPVAYAHLAREPGVPRLALQYWFYYWFNHFNDLHESDWEMIQLVFDAETPGEALARRPSEIAYAQHGGGERADWDDSKVEKADGTHPVIYVASGSHASQYEQALYLGRGRQGAGLGCDDTRPESFSVRPEPVVVSTSPAPTDADAWLTYRGQWGQYARGFSNGITGPNMKAQWRFPFAWMDGLRTSTPKMPVSESAGTTVTTFFCQAIIAVAGAGNFVGNRNWVLGLVLLGILALVAIPVWRTTWRPAPLLPLRQRRAAGQVLRVAGRLYRLYGLTLLSLVVVVVGLAFGITRLLQFLRDHTGVNIELTLGDPGIDSFSAFVLFAPGYPLLLMLVGAPFVALLRRIDAGEPALPWAAFREIIPLVPRLLGTMILAFLTVAALEATVIGLPFAMKKAVDWTFAGQEIVFERRKARAALAASTRRVRGHWWSVAGVDLALFFLGALVGPLGGAALIILTDVPLWTINAIGLAVFGLALPFMMTTLTLMYLDPRSEEKAAGRAWRSRLAFWRREAAAPARAGT